MRTMLGRLCRMARDAWLMLGLAILLLIGLELGSWVVYAVHRRVVLDVPNYQHDWREHSEIFGGAPWALDYWREFNESNQARWYSYIYWRRKPYAGTHIRIDSKGLRKTYNATPFSESKIKIAMLGGSTLWGTGARDDHTIPSYVSRLLEQERGRGVHVTNLGETGYVSTQEVIQLVLELKRGNVPDVVIFYDGVNDVTSAFHHGEAGLPENEENRRVEFNLSKTTLDPVKFGILRFFDVDSRLMRGLRAFTRRVRIPRGRAEGPGAPGARSGEQATLEAERLAEATIRNYLSNARLVQTLGREHGFEAFFFWQPVLFSKSMLSPEERETRKIYVGRGTDTYDLEFHDLVYARVASDGLVLGKFRDLQGLFGQDDRTYYMDYCHLSEAGNEVVARAIVQALRRESKALERL